jgi:hypothetical protein
VSNYKNIQLIAYGSVTSAPTRVLPTGAAPNSYKEDAQLRAKRLCAVADWVASRYASALKDPNTLKVFVLPEFYFRYGGPSEPAETLRDSYPNAEILLPNITEEILKPHFKGKTYADWLIVSGSMFWHKSAADSGTTHPTYFNTALVLRGGTDVELTPEERSANDEPDEVPTMGAASTNQKAMMSHIDYAFGRLGRDRQAWDAALNPMFQPVLGDWDWWRWHMFHVHGVNDAKGRPLVFGLEVCLEHVQARVGAQPDEGVLRALRRQTPSLPEIDVQIVTSCGMSLDPADGVEARVGGQTLHCDGMEPDAEDALWPTAQHARVLNIDQKQVHLVGPTSGMLDRVDLPTNLQTGIPGSQHNPPDAVSVWNPAPLAAGSR